MLKTMAFPAALLAAFTLPAQAQLIVGNDQSGTATIYNVDPTTGIATPIHSGTTNDAKPWGMAYDAATNTLYWNNGSVLYSSPLGATLTPSNLGTMMFSAAAVNFVALSFHNGELYGTRNIATEAVYRIDPVTLVATQTYVYPTTFDFGGLDHDLSTGLLYGLTDAAAAPAVRGLYQIDDVAMTTTFIAPYPAGETDIDALAVGNGLAYYVTDGPNTTQASFYVIDIATGMQVATIPSPFTGSGTFAAATWAGNTAPPQSTPFCFGDGTGTACPCANSGAAGNGCASSINANGANLTTSGSPSLANDTLVLLGSGMPDSSALYFQGTLQAGGGLGVAFGDGLRCAAGTIVRLKTVTNVGGASQYPQAGDPSVSVKGMVAAPGIRTYQVWYRNAAAFCTTSTFNLTNGVEVNWLP
jgi:hypothetical protein